MRHVRSAVIAGALALALPSLAMAQTPTTLTIPLTAQNGSGVTGTAVITDLGGGKSKVVLTVSGGKTATTGPAHIHAGKCPEPGAVVAPLTNVANGTSTTELAVPVVAVLPPETVRTTLDLPPPRSVITAVPVTPDPFWAANGIVKVVGVCAIASEGSARANAPATIAERTCLMW